MRETLEQLWHQPTVGLAVFLFGLCVGSFLNVVIYRLPRGLNVHKPKRSFCPQCHTQLPWWQNIPVFTWLFQKGKCKSCGVGIPISYLLVELATGVLWLMCWHHFSTPQEALLYMCMGAICIAIWQIDTETMLIPRPLTILGTLIAFIGAALMPERFDEVFWWRGLLYSIFGFLLGWFSLYSVVLLGKLLFGKRQLNFDKPMAWSLREPEDEDEELSFVIDNNEVGENEEIPWSYLFYRPTDKLVINGSTSLLIDGKEHQCKQLEIKADHILVQGENYPIEELTSLSGTATQVTIPREAMGMGDVNLLGMLGALLGPKSLIIIVLFACFFSLSIALINRVGLGKEKPFGPSLIAGAVFYLLYGEQVWTWYINLFSV